MCASPLRLLRAGPPAPKVALLPDGLFFTRVIPIAAGATAAEAATQIELALETISPFPLAQLYYGWFWTPGMEQAFAYAAYRRRFTAEQTAAWADAELVVPVSAALLGADVQPATTAVEASEEGLTAMHWASPPAPAKVLFRAIDPEATEDDRARVRDELIAAMGGTKTVIDLPGAPVPESGDSDNEIVFRSGEFVSRLSANQVTALDVRDKGDLAALRAAKKRDVILWRIVLGTAAALLLLGLGEIALGSGHAWHKVRLALLNGRKPDVQRIMTSQQLANSIDDLVEKRLLPLEMLTAMVGVDTELKPADIMVTRVQTVPSAGIYTLLVDVTTTNPAQISAYKAQLKNLPECEDVVETFRNAQGDRSTFELKITFKPGVLKPATSV